MPAALVVDLAADDRFDWHAHDQHQLALAARGVVVLAVDGAKWVLPRSRALWIPAGIRHAVTATGETGSPSLQGRAHRRLRRRRRVRIAPQEPLAGLITTYTDSDHRRHHSIGATASPWLFPGHHPGRPITPSRLGDRLTPLGIDARAGRRAALLQLGSQLPAPVLADALGITATTATDWVKAAGGDWANYAADTARDRFAQPR